MNRNKKLLTTGCVCLLASIVCFIWIATKTSVFGAGRNEIALSEGTSTDTIQQKNGRTIARGKSHPTAQTGGNNEPIDLSKNIEVFTNRYCSDGKNGGQDILSVWIGNLPKDSPLLKKEYVPRSGDIINFAVKSKGEDENGELTYYQFKVDHFSNSIEEGSDAWALVPEVSICDKNGKNPKPDSRYHAVLSCKNGKLRIELSGYGPDKGKRVYILTPAAREDAEQHNAEQHKGGEGPVYIMFEQDTSKDAPFTDKVVDTAEATSAAPSQQTTEQ